MDSLSTHSSLPLAAADFAAAAPAAPWPDQKLETLSKLVDGLADPALAPDRLDRITPLSSEEAALENRLAQARLGVAAGLLAALRAKDAPTAAHSLRVALGVSSWSLAAGMKDEDRDRLEVAALLHDIGKIGVPDRVLLKPASLSTEELESVERRRQIGVEILRNSQAPDEVLEIVQFCSAWYDGRKPGFSLAGDRLPLGARMLSIVDAFDAMTTDQVYRRSMSRERAMAELFEFAGAQFDPQLVREFCSLLAADRVKLNAEVARRWLTELSPESANTLWRNKRAPVCVSAQDEALLFHEQVFDAMPDGMVFVDQGLKILRWNAAAERLTGITAASVEQKQFACELLEFEDERGEPLSEETCPLTAAVKTGAQTSRRLEMRGRTERRVAVDVQAWPVLGTSGGIRGAALLLHDASSQISLEERVQTLHLKATRDPLTQVSNRAEFDRQLALFVDRHLSDGAPCSLIICDIDHFKRVNDTFGHQAGDDALVSFAALLRRNHRPGDVVARYGGEEFVMLCADCDNATATEKAESLRKQLEHEPQPRLGGKRITASFGVTEIQDGDTPETMLRRADRALLKAKELGRNTVVQLGSGISRREQEVELPSWLSWLRRRPPDQLLKCELITPVPLKMAVEKLRGFVADHQAQILSIDEEFVALEIDVAKIGLSRRTSDRPAPYVLEMSFSEKQLTIESGGQAVRTGIDVALRPKRSRDRRQRDALEKARRVLASLKSYLMAQEVAAQAVSVGRKRSGR